MSHTLPGILAALLVAVVANMLHKAIVVGGQNPVSAVVLAIVIGIAVRAYTGKKQQLEPGLSFCVKKILRLAIILMGFDLKLSLVFATGGSTLGIILAAVGAGLFSAIYIGRLMGLGHNLSLLIGTGTAICGASAIVAAAPVVGADDSDVSYSVATITLFGIAAVFLYPAFGALIGMSDTAFGTWAGTAVHDTSQVLAAAFTFSESAGRTATVVKLTRTALLAPLILLLGAMCAKQNSTKLDFRTAAKCFPYFVLWFLAASVVRTAVDAAYATSPAAWSAFLSSVKSVSRFLIVLAMAATGMMTDLKRMKSVGAKPFLAGLMSALIVGLVSFVLIALR